MGERWRAKRMWMTLPAVLYGSLGRRDCCMSHSLVLFAEGRLCIAPYWNDGYPYGPWRGVRPFSHQTPILHQTDSLSIRAHQLVVDMQPTSIVIDTPTVTTGRPLPNPLST
ncbi:hypothetical protein C8R44DRAFT_879977 [Mycena epipterygia]|nr:hypothetical protein C8R44DRAFT_879977 [Mycena epipterygia]